MFIGRHFLTKNRVQSMSIDQADSSISIKWGKPRQHTLSYWLMGRLNERKP